MRCLLEIRDLLTYSIVVPFRTSYRRIDDKSPDNSGELKEQFFSYKLQQITNNYTHNNHD